LYIPQHVQDNICQYSSTTQKVHMVLVEQDIEFT